MLVIPDSGTAALANPGDETALNVVLDTTLAAVERGGDLVSATPVVLDGDHWVPFEWPADATAAASTVTRSWWTAMYEKQRPILEKFYQSIGADVVVTAAQLEGDSDATLYSYTTLPAGATVALPLVDELRFVWEDGSTAVADFADIQAELPGVLVEIPQTVPLRFGLTRVPAARELEALDHE